MIEGTVTRRSFAMTLSEAVALPAVRVRQAQAADTFREGLQAQSDFLARIETWRASQPVLPSRPAAIIQLAGVGLDKSGH
jgi:hypothetical protein